MMSFLAVGWAFLGISSLSVKVIDAFDRDVTLPGVTLVDWEGPIANPAPRLRLDLPASIEYPVDVYLHTNSRRIHFDRESPDDRTGIGRRMRLASESAPTSFRMAIYPDQDGIDEEYVLTIQVFRAGAEVLRTTAPVRVRDEDKPAPTPAYPILLDFLEDRTEFFENPDHRQVLRKAADDWQFFLDDQEVDPTPAGDEPIRIWNADGFVSSRAVNNRESYLGFLVYASGIRHQELRAGGAPSRQGKPHIRGGQPTPLRRSGAVNFEVRGNWNTLGWFVDDSDDNWWVSGSLRGEPNDFYSIALHELGHALGFEGTYPLFREAKRDGFRDEELTRYLGFSPTVDASDHFPRVIDPVSGYGGFGMEYLGEMKSRRWLITKSHLLMLQAIGYRLRKTSAFLGISTAFDVHMVEQKVGTEVSIDPRLTGGVPDYFVVAEGGGLPPGLELDSFTGKITGRPTTAGQWICAFEVQDQDPTTGPKRYVVGFRVSA